MSCTDCSKWVHEDCTSSDRCYRCRRRSPQRVVRSLGGHLSRLTRCACSTHFSVTVAGNQVLSTWLHTRTHVLSCVKRNKIVAGCLVVIALHRISTLLHSFSLYRRSWVTSISHGFLRDRFHDSFNESFALFLLRRTSHVLDTPGVALLSTIGSTVHSSMVVRTLMVVHSSTVAVPHSVSQYSEAIFCMKFTIGIPLHLHFRVLVVLFQRIVECHCLWMSDWLR